VIVVVPFHTTLSEVVVTVKAPVLELMVLSVRAGRTSVAEYVTVGEVPETENRDAALKVAV